MKKIILIFSAFVFLFVFQQSFAKTAKTKEFINKPVWEKHAGKYDYTETYKTFDQNKKDKVRKRKEAAPINLPGLKYGIFGIVIVVLVFLLVMLLLNVIKGMNKDLKPTKSRISGFKFENLENIEDADLEGLLEQALSEKLYKEAIRIRYLLIIRVLSRLLLVVWKKDKTNGAYINEMYGKKGFDLFRQLTISFERIWYGDREINEQEYNRLSPQFVELHNEVSAKESHVENE